jgi:BirA family biotin operon repressor/biotin-[acetyl-CoA-carboxylase] ligase
MLTAIDWKVHTYAQLESTQDYVRDIAEDEEFFDEGIAVQCLMQTKGRGRQGNEWSSPAGNLYLSVLLRPNCKAQIAGQLSFVVAVALMKAIKEYLNPEHNISLKWPNDILIDGKKVAGILLESNINKLGQVDYVIVGTGVNILAHPEGAVALKDVSANPVPVHPFRDVYLRHLSQIYRRWQNEGFSLVRDEWLLSAHGIGGPITARMFDRKEFGTFDGIDLEGRLLLKQDDGSTKLISAGEVFFGVE